MMQILRYCKVLSEQTSDSSSFLNAMCPFNLWTQLWTAFFIFHISIRINFNRISEGLLYYPSNLIFFQVFSDVKCRYWIYISTH
jgi:hypothetical protein